MVWRTLSESLITGGIVGREVLRFREQRGRGVPLGQRISRCAYKSPYWGGCTTSLLSQLCGAIPVQAQLGLRAPRGGDGLRFLKKRRYPPAKASFEQIC